MEVIDEHVEKARNILENPKYGEPGMAKEQRKALYELSKGVFDFVEIAKRSLARGWLRFTPDQRREFTDAFSRLLADVYLSRLQKNYKGSEQVQLVSQEIDGRRAEVKSYVIHEGARTPVIYKMIMSGGRWKVYDVKVEEISMVQNYRSQFREYLLNNSPEALIEQVKEKMKTEEDIGK